MEGDRSSDGNSNGFGGAALFAIYAGAGALVVIIATVIAVLYLNHRKNKKEEDDSADKQKKEWMEACRLAEAEAMKKEVDNFNRPYKTSLKDDIIDEDRPSFSQSLPESEDTYDIDQTEKDIFGAEDDKYLDGPEFESNSEYESSSTLLGAVLSVPQAPPLPNSRPNSPPYKNIPRRRR